MTRRSREVGIIKSFVLGAALAAALAAPAQAGDNKLSLSATTVFTTDYIFRGYTNTGNGPAVQPEFDLTYGMFYAGIWGSNIKPAAGTNVVTGAPENIGDIEIDYYAGITPKWSWNSSSVTFNIGALYYTYPNYCEGKCGLLDPDYFELKTAATWTGGNWSLGVANYWSDEYFGFAGNSDALEGSVGYAFSGKLFNFFSPTISGLVGYQWFEEVAEDYAYWNAGLTLGFMEHWSVDVRYWDTDLSTAGCFTLTTYNSDSGCDARVVGTLKAVF
jgi:uncharacterized protein (TIGR02001 family)